MSTDPNCIFCKIANKEIPTNAVYEDGKFIAFMDINPRSTGHVQVIPKDHVRWVWDVPQIGEYFEVARKVAKAQQKAFDTEMIRSQVYGEDVPHAHIWVFPDEDKGDKTDFAANAEKIRANL